MKRSTDKFEVVERKIVSDRCVVLDVATAAELPQLGANRSTGAAVGHGRAGEQPGLCALGASPLRGGRLRRHLHEYARSSNALRTSPNFGRLWARSLDGSRVARNGLARQAVSDAGRADECAVAFSPSGDIDTPEGQGTWTSVAASAF